MTSCAGEFTDKRRAKFPKALPVRFSASDKFAKALLARYGRTFFARVCVSDPDPRRARPDGVRPKPIFV
eukprot:1409217-Rhodomonas_salina.2